MAIILNWSIFSGDSTYKASTNKDIAEHPLYNVYLWVSETLLRLGPIVTLTILNILIIVRFNRIAKKRENLKGPAVNRTPTTHKNGKTNSLKRSASPAVSGGLTNGPSPIQAPLQQRSVSPIACVIDQVNNGTASINGNLLTVPTNGPPAIISLDHVSDLHYPSHRWCCLQVVKCANQPSPLDLHLSFGLAKNSDGERRGNNRKPSAVCMASRRMKGNQYQVWLRVTRL